MTLPVGVELGGRLSFDNQDIPIASFRIIAGTWTCLLGSSGVGKSTLLRLIAGLPVSAAFSGTINSSDGDVLTDRISYMAQSDLLVSWLNVRDNVGLGTRLRGERLDVERCMSMIERVGLLDHWSKFPTELSGGMRQRVALARTLMEERPVALLDEPFSALDARTRSEMQDLAFSALAGKTVLIVTHDPAEAIRLGDHMYLMTEKGIQELPLPASAPIRPVDDPESLAAQARLLVLLRKAG